MSESRVPAEARDPVCGMALGPRTTAIQVEHRGKLYWFCSRECRDAFLLNPSRYTEPARPPGGSPG